MLKPLLILAIAMSAEPQSTGGMRLLARAAPRITLLPPKVDRELIVNGSGGVEAVRNQVEVALRRCGFTIVEGALPSAVAYINITGLSHKNLGYSGNAHVLVAVPMMVNGEGVLIIAFEDAFLFSGSTGNAASQVRSAIAQLLDQFCNEYLKARDAVRSEKGKQP